MPRSVNEPSLVTTGYEEDDPAGNIRARVGERSPIGDTFAVMLRWKSCCERDPSDGFVCTRLVREQRKAR